MPTVDESIKQLHNPRGILELIIWHANKTMASAGKRPQFVHLGAIEMGYFKAEIRSKPGLATAPFLLNSNGIYEFSGMPDYSGIHRFAYFGQLRRFGAPELQPP